MTDRFDKFTERARKVLQLAQEEAQRFNHNYIGTEHLLLGLVREGDGVAARVLGNMGIELHKVRSTVEFVIGRGDRMVMGEMGLTPRAKRVIELAVDEARRLNHHYIGTEHLLLGLVREGEGIAAGVLESQGVSLEKVRVQVIEVLKRSSGYSGLNPPSPSALDDLLNSLSAHERQILNMRLNLTGAFPRSQEEVADAFGVSVEQVRRIEAEILRLFPALDPQLGDAERRARTLMMGNLSDLTDREWQVLIMRFGLGGGPRQSNEDIAKALGISLDEVRQMEASILRKQPNIAEQFEMYKEKAETPEPDAPLNLSVQQIRTLFDYSIWARDQLLGPIEKLDETQRRNAPESGAYGSIHDTLAHMAVSEWLWLHRCLGESPLKLPKGEDFANLRVLVDWWNEVHAEATGYLSTLTEDELDREITYTAPDGKTRTRKVWHMLLQVPNHQTEHRSQIATMLGQMGVEVPPTDLVVYLSNA